MGSNTLLGDLEIFFLFHQLSLQYRESALRRRVTRTLPIKPIMSDDSTDDRRIVMQNFLKKAIIAVSISQRNTRESSKISLKVKPWIEAAKTFI